jgi:hypothetical protein
VSGLADAITQIQAVIGALEGIKAAPAAPPEQLSGEFPFSVCYPGEGDWNEAVAGLKQALHTIIVEIHLQRGDLPSDVTAALAYADSVPNALFKALGTDRLGGTISTFSGIHYVFGALDWGGMTNIGWRWSIQGVKIQSEVS